MVYTADDYIFGLTVTVLGGLILLILSRLFEWIKDLYSDVKENRERIEELERKLKEISEGGGL
jgi:hypothetical protein